MDALRSHLPRDRGVERLRARKGIVVATVIASAAFVIRFVQGPQTIDDAYISFRYARNLAEGLGFVYNPGEHVLGTTTPLWTLILALWYRLGFSDLPSAALFMAAAADAATVILLFLLAWRLGFKTGWAILLSSVVAFSAGSVDFATAGMETSLFSFLALAAVVVFIFDLPGWSIFTASMAALTRPEGLLILLLVFASLIWQRRWHARLALGALPLLVWFVFAFCYFSSPIPQTLRAKAVVYSGPTNRVLGNALTVVSIFAAPGANVFAFGRLPLPQADLFMGLLFLAIIAYGLIRSSFKSLSYPETLVLLGFPFSVASLNVARGWQGIPINFPWYLIPVVPYFALGLVSGIKTLTARVPVTLQGLAAASLLAWTFLGFSLGRETDCGILSPVGRTVVRENGYRAAADWLATRLSAEDLVAVPEIGAFGYFSNARILDTIGLVTPGSLAYYPQAIGRLDHIPPDLVRENRPKYVLALSVFLDPGLTEAEWFRRDYRTVHEFADSRFPWDSKVLRIYARDDSP